MNQATFRFYAELNDFLPLPKKQTTFAHHFAGRVSVKHLIESLGIPHTEIDLILVNGHSVDFAHIVQHEDRVTVYPVFESINIAQAVRLRPKPLRQTRFILDIHLGQLATYLRLIGFDTLYRNDYQDEELARLSYEHQRILLTKDRGLLKRNLVTHGYCVRDIDPEQQLVEVVGRFDLRQSINPFNRCLRCNGLLQGVAKEEINHLLRPNTRRYYDEFRICQECQQIYWKGSHYQRMCRFLKKVLDFEL
jgi:uncharacterized protein with PIN domain/sulfur carrier protein ThiS